ncbi:MAG: FAD:protein FMN transferase [Lachnospiraceae bacterium]|nr:FAD:protein FMN transferase [Lachnospiraceae bacterium]
MITAIICLLSLAACLSGCGLSGMPHAEKNGLFFDTVVSVEIYGKNAEELAGQCMDKCAYYESIFDKNNPASDIARINSGGGSPVSVSSETVDLIKKSFKYSELSDGLFDITIGPVSSLWDFHKESEDIPSESDLKDACQKVGYKNVTVSDEDCTVTVPEGYMIDAGAAAKGYIADRLAEFLSSDSITGAIINMGGDMRLVGTKPDGSLFNIGINDPEADGVICAMYLSDESVATSGTYERCFYSGGKRYHHILDPKSGYPAETDIESVTVITPGALDSDCLCTVAIMLGSDRAIKLIESLDDTEAVILKTDGSILKTQGADSYIR